MTRYDSMLEDVRHSTACRETRAPKSSCSNASTPTPLLIFLHYLQNVYPYRQKNASFILLTKLHTKVLYHFHLHLTRKRGNYSVRTYFPNICLLLRKRYVILFINQNDRESGGIFYGIRQNQQETAGDSGLYKK